MRTATAFVVVLVLGLALCGTIQDSNRFIDDFLGRIHDSRLDNGLTVPDFDLKIYKTGITNRDLKGKFQNGKVKGFNAIKRKGDCSPTALVGGNITLSCKLDLSGVYVQYSATVKGYSLAGTEKTIDMKVKIKETTGLLEATQDPRRDPTLRTFYIESLKFELDYPDLGLNDDRKKALKEEIVKKATPEVYNALYSQYNAALRDALNRSTRLPPV